MDELIALSGWGLAVAGALLAAVERQGRRATRMRIARAAHEIRGPLTALRFGLELAEREGAASPSRVTAMAGELEAAGRSLEDLTGNERGGESRLAQGFDLGLTVASVVQAWQAVAAASGARLTLVPAGGPAPVQGDRIRISRAVGNLIANALEHGEEPVQVRVAAAPRVVRVEVLDHGAGLPARVDALAASGRPGAARGHGLPIASATAHDHGGRLAAAPSRHGARLVLELPRSQAQAPGSVTA